MKHSIVLVAVMLTACALGQGAAEGRRVAPGEASWRVRLDLDSAPAHPSRVRTIVGTIDFERSAHDLDFRPLLGHGVASGTEIEVVKHINEVRGGSVTVAITLGDLRSDHATVVLNGTLSPADTMFGTWNELQSCCRAGGRFALWRDPR